MKKEITLFLNIPCRLPSLPNFILLPDGSSVGIENVTDENLKIIGQEWTNALISKAQERRNHD